MPLIVLVGGSTGTGKSTVAVEVAHRLGITRVASTDFIRQTMRAFFSPESCRRSTTRASKRAGARRGGDRRPGDRRLPRAVPATCCVGVDAAIRRALTEGWSMVLEGVHLVPGLVPTQVEGALLVHVVLEIADEDVHRMHFHVEGQATGGVRAMDKYLDPHRGHPAHPELHRGARGGRACRWSRTRTSSGRSTR